MKLRIGILGTRGIPNHYGGFEYFAEHISRGLVQRGHEVFVYNSHNHPNRDKCWNGVNIIHCYDPEYILGSFGQFVYDLNCILDARRKKYDILLFLGYTSSSVWGMLYPREPVIISNMDGLEWKRSKYSGLTRRFLQYAEKLAVKYSDHFVADSTWIQTYLQNKYQVAPTYLAYGAGVFNQSNERVLQEYHLQKYSYNMLMARMEPENNIEMILDGYALSDSERDFIVIGNTNNKFGTRLLKKFAGDKRIRFLGAIFNQHHINNLMYYSNLYFHGHSVGGTNPSLLEAMGSNTLIVAQDNVFNSAVLNENAYYFTTAAQVCHYANTLSKTEHGGNQLRANTAIIEHHYSWQKIIEQYETYFLTCYRERYPATATGSITAAGSQP